MVFSVQPQVAKGGAGQQEKAEGVLLAAQSVMRAAMAKVWRQQQEQQLGYTQSQSQGSQSQGSQSQSQSQGGGVRCTSRQDLAREVHSAILAMYAATAGTVCMPPTVPAWLPCMASLHGSHYYVSRCDDPLSERSFMMSYV